MHVYLGIKSLSAINLIAQVIKTLIESQLFFFLFLLLQIKHICIKYYFCSNLVACILTVQSLVIWNVKLQWCQAVHSKLHKESFHTYFGDVLHYRVL